MVSTVKSRPNHYELLGITPAATADEIRQAFVKELSLLRPRAFGTLAEVTVAYETLRDPAKRKAYDASLGFEPDPPAPEPRVPPEWAPFLLRASAKPVERPVVDLIPAVPPTPRTSLQSRLETPPARRTAPSASALLRQPIRPDPRDIQPVLGTKPENLIRPKTAAVSEATEPETEPPQFEPRADADHVYYAPLEAERFDEAERPSKWKVPALGAGALLLAVGVGAWTGWDAGNDGGSDQLKQAATIKVPPAKAASALADPLPATVVDETPRDQPRPPAATPSRIASVRAPLQIDLPEVETASAEQGKGEQFTSDAAPAEEKVAHLPLPNSVIARTIGRIGYSCGRVSSTAPVEGEAGVFNVTCTSGQSFRATPVQGRYRFRRLN